MRGVAAVCLPVALLLAVALMSQSVSTSGYTTRTSRRVVRRLVEESQRAMAQEDKNVVLTLVARATARAWAQAAAVLAGEDGARKATGVDLPSIVDQAQRDMDTAVSALNVELGRKHRVRKDQVLCPRTLGG